MMREESADAVRDSEESLASARLLRVSPSVVVVREDTSGRVILDASAGKEYAVSAELGAALDCFGIPRTVESALAHLQRREGVTPARARQLIRGLLQKALIEPYCPTHGTGAAASRDLRQPGAGMFGCPILPLAQVLAGDVADVVFLGIPYDLGTSFRPGARFGPEVLRRASRAVFQYGTRDGIPRGAYDPVRRARILERVRMADLGDVRADAVMQQNGAQFARLSDAVARLLAAERLPVILGGDHSATLPVVLGAARAHTALGVLHFDAHNDYAGPAEGPWTQHLHHGNFMSWVASISEVQRVVQFGIRQLESDPAPAHPNVVVWPGLEACDASDDQILATIPEHLPYHLSVDADCLDPSVLSATGTPLPGGYSRSQLLRLLELVCSRRRVVSVDVMELAAVERDSERDALLLADLLVHVLHEANVLRETDVRREPSVLHDREVLHERSAARTDS